MQVWYTPGDCFRLRASILGRFSEGTNDQVGRQPQALHAKLSTVQWVSFSPSFVNTTLLSTRNCPKLLPQFCGPWLIVQKLSDVAYRLDLPQGCHAHPVFHVSKLKHFIYRDTNLIHGLISLQEDASSDHSPDKILDQREKQL